MKDQTEQDEPQRNGSGQEGAWSASPQHGVQASSRGPSPWEAGLHLTENTQLEEDILNQRVLCFQERFLQQALSPLP